MADTENKQTEGTVQQKKTEVRENGENDDDDDVVMDGKKTPRTSNGNAGSDRESIESKSPRTPKKSEDRAESRPATATLNGKEESVAGKGMDDRPPSAKVEERTEKDPLSRPPSAKVDKVEESPEESARKEGNVSRNEKPDEASEDKSPALFQKETPSVTLGDDGVEKLDISRASTPRSRHEEGLKTPSPNKSRSSTPGGREEESESESKSPNKSRSSTPAEPQQAVQEELKIPPRSPDTRSSTPAATENNATEISEPEYSENMLRGKSAGSDRTPSKSPVSERAPSKSPVSDRAPSKSPVSDRAPSKSPVSERAPSKSPVSERAPSKSPVSERASSKSPKPPATPDGQEKLSVPVAAQLPPKSPQDGVKGFDNGQRRSLSARSSPRSPQSPSSPKSALGSGKTADGEKKKTTFVEDPKDDERKTGSRSSRPTRIQRTLTPANIHAKPEKKSSKKQGVENGSATNESAGSNAVATTNGVDKRSTTGLPVKSPSKSTKSLPQTPDTPSSTSGDKKKLPMNKVQVGAAPSPNLKTVRSKIGSLDNASYKPGGGKVKIENRKLDFSKAQPKIAAKNDKYTPSGGDKKITQVKLQWNAKPKVGSLDNATYKPGGGDKKIETVKLDFKDKAKPKVGSKDNAKHTPGGGSVKIQTQKVDIKAESKIGSLDNVKHKPGGGDKKIFNDKDYLRQTGSNVESLSGSGLQSPVPPGAITDDQNGLPTSDENLNQEC